MARQLRIEFKGAIYHVMARMLGETPAPGTDGDSSWLLHNRLFLDDADRTRFLERLATRVEEYNIRLYVFVLMVNHVHLVFETPAGNCSRFMQSLLTAYTVYFNLRHHRHGHLFDGRYKAKLVDGDAYLLALSRYVHLNPVRVGALRKKSVADRLRYLRAYPWSSYPGYVGKANAFKFVEYEPILTEMSANRRLCAGRYRKFVEVGCSTGDERMMAALKASPHGIGGERFCAWVDGLYQKRVAESRQPKDARFRNIRNAVDKTTVLAVLSKVFETQEECFRQRRRNSVLRGVAARCLCKHAGLTQREAAAVLGMGSGAAVGRQLRKMAGLLGSDRQLKGMVAEVDRMLQPATNVGPGVKIKF